MLGLRLRHVCKRGYWAASGDLSVADITLVADELAMQHPCHRVNTLRPRQNGRHFADDIYKWIFLNENVWIPIKISLKFVPRGPINNIPALVQIMAWRRSGDKPLSEPIMVGLTTHICVTRPQWVNPLASGRFKWSWISTFHGKFRDCRQRYLLWNGLQMNITGPHWW